MKIAEEKRSTRGKRKENQISKRSVPRVWKKGVSEKPLRQDFREGADKPRGKERSSQGGLAGKNVGITEKRLGKRNQQKD